MKLEGHAPLVDSIIRVLEKNNISVSREEIEEKVADNLNRLRNQREVQRLVLKDYGLDLPRRAELEAKKMSEVAGDEQNLQVKVRVMEVRDKEILQNGVKSSVKVGVFGDDTGVLRFTSWVPFPYAEGDVLLIRHAYAKKWGGTPEIQIGKKAVINKLDEELVVNVSTQKVDLRDLKQGMSGVCVVGRVMQISERTVNVSGVEKKVWSGMIGDATGKAYFTSWHDFGLKEGDVIRISGGYVTTWRGSPQLVFDGRATVEHVDADLPDIEELSRVRHARIEELYSMNNIPEIQITGTVLEIKKGSGYIRRCSRCNRVMQGMSCSVHGKTDSVPDLRVKAVVDDGTGALTAVFNTALTEKILGKSLDQCKKEVVETAAPEVIEEELRERMLTVRYRLTGSVSMDDYGATMYVRDFERDRVNPQERISALLEDLEVEG